MKENRKKKCIFFVVIMLGFVAFAQKGESGELRVLQELEERVEELEKYKINQKEFNERIKELNKEINLLNVGRDLVEDVVNENKKNIDILNKEPKFGNEQINAAKNEILAIVGREIEENFNKYKSELDNKFDEKYAGFKKDKVGIATIEASRIRNNNELISANRNSVAKIEEDLNDVNNAFLDMQNRFSNTDSIIKRLENNVQDKDALLNLKRQIDNLVSRQKEIDIDEVDNKITDISVRLRNIEEDLIRPRRQGASIGNQYNSMTLIIIVVVVVVVVIFVFLLFVFRKKDAANNNQIVEPIRTKSDEEIQEMLLCWWNMDGGKGIGACEINLRRIDFSICWTLSAPEDKDKWEAIAVKHDYKGDVLYMVLPKGLVKYSLIESFFHHEKCEGIDNSNSYVNVESLQKPAIIEIVKGAIDEDTIKKGNVVISNKDNKIAKRSSWNLVRNVITSYKSSKIDTFLESEDFKDRLVVWWKANCETSISACKRSLKTAFSEFEDDVAGCFAFDIKPEGKGVTAGWSYIFVSINKTQELYYILPCKGLRFSGYVKKYFDNVSASKSSSISETNYEIVYSLKKVAKIKKVVIKNKNSRPDDYELIEKGKVALVLNRKHDGVTPPISQLAIKEATEKDLIDWWGSNGNKGFEEVKKSLRAVYGPSIKIELILGQKENVDNWNLIGLMKNNNTDLFYVLPRKYLFVREVQDWFDVQGVGKRNASERVYIKNIKKVAKIDAEELKKFKNIQYDSDTIVKVVTKKNGIVELENE
ncbi:MAG: hypothetical protein ACUZ8E_09205 [Candidatus Anammoxibacter sp.]